MTRGIAPARGARKLITALFVLLSAAPAAAGTVTLEWSPNPEPDVVGYVVYWGTASGQYGTTVDVGGSTTFQFYEPDPTIRYYFAVAAYNVAGARSVLSGEVSTDPAPTSIAITSLSASATPPQIAGTTITFTASAAGGIAPHEFKWLLWDGTNWSGAQEWSTSNSFSWTPTTANANYSVGVWVRSAGSVVDGPENANAGTSMAFAITSGSAVSITNLTANKSSPQAAGTSVTFTATATGATSYQYKWWMSKDGGVWSIAQEWASSNRLGWTPSADGSYQVLVRVRNAANSTESSGVTLTYLISPGRSGNNGNGNGKGKPK